MVKKIIFSSILLILCSCSNKTTLANLDSLNSKKSVYLEKVFGRFKIMNMPTDQTDIYNFGENDIFSAEYETWGCTHKKAIGKWKLDDSLLYISQSESISYNCDNKEQKDGVKYNIWEKDSGLIVFKIIEATNTTIKLCPPDSKKCGMAIELQKMATDNNE